MENLETTQNPSAQKSSEMSANDGVNPQTKSSISKKNRVNVKSSEEPTPTPRLGTGPERMEFDGCPNTEDGGHIEIEKKSIHYDFYGEYLLRQKAPKMMEFVDVIVEEWQSDGHFINLPVSNPIAKRTVSKAFRRAKKMEKTLEDKGVFAAAKMGIDTLKAKIEKRSQV